MNEVTMNFFYDLPDELQDKIFKCAHKIKFDICLCRINYCFDEHFSSAALKNMALHLYSTGVSNFELNNYFECLNWLDGNTPFDYDESRNNVYYIIFEDYWLSHF
jgi:hypothetical protein